MAKYYPPKADSSSFNCAICGVFAKQVWGQLEYEGTPQKSSFKYSTCSHCLKRCFWHLDRMIVPGDASVPFHHEDLPESCIDDYNEARDIVGRSPKAAAALMRLVVQKLILALGQPGKNINDEIGNLVKAGMPVQVQQALDYCRVVGNNAVHPGEIVIDEDPTIAHTLFEMVNFVVDDRITKPKKIAEFYAKLPQGALDAVSRRDLKA